MAKLTEKRLYLVPPQSFTANGDASGKITIADTTKFVVGHIVVVKSNTQPNLTLKVKRIISRTEMFVGPEKEPIQVRSDLSLYLVADTATVQAAEQNRPSIPEQDIERNTYAEEPTVARRVTLIDPMGDQYDGNNPLPVDATISTSNADTPVIYNVSAVVKDTEYSQLLPNNTAHFMLRARNNSRLQLAYAAGQTNVNFLTLVPGNIYNVEAVKLTGTTIYFQANKDNTIVEIVAWI